MRAGVRGGVGVERGGAELLAGEIAGDAAGDGGREEIGGERSSGRGPT